MPAKRFMLWLSMAGSALVFGALIVAHAILTTAPGWQSFELPTVFLGSTLAILASSYTMHLSGQFAAEDELDKLQRSILLTFLLGLLFALLQGLGWARMIEAYEKTGIRNAVAFIYLLSGLHMLHALGGLAYLGYTLASAFRWEVHRKKLDLITDCGAYWHFLDGVWVAVVFFLYIFN